MKQFRLRDSQPFYLHIFATRVEILLGYCRFLVACLISIWAASINHGIFVKVGFVSVRFCKKPQVLLKWSSGFTHFKLILSWSVTDFHHETPPKPPGDETIRFALQETKKVQKVQRPNRSQPKIRGANFKKKIAEEKLKGWWTWILILRFWVSNFSSYLKRYGIFGVG